MTHATPSPVNRPIRSRWRLLAAVVLVITAVVHLYLAPEHLEEAPYIGVLFVLLAVACFVLVSCLPRYDTTLVWWGIAVVDALALIAYVLSRSVGLPQIGDDIGHWTEPLGLTAIIAEAVALLVAVVAVASSRSVRR